MLKKDSSNFVKVLWLLILVIAVISAIFIALISFNSSVALIALMIAFVITLLLFLLYIAVLIVITRQILSNKRIGSGLLNMYSSSIRVIYPMMGILCDMASIDKNSIRRVFSDLNNRIVFLQAKPLKKEDILMITPHCLQLSTCTHKVTGEINNCKMCGMCNIDGLLRLSNEYGVKLIVVTGGTLARKIIMDNRPKGIIAIACERDLTHGILDIKNIPVIGIKNDRPNGPCFNTKVDLERVEEAINYFLGGTNGN